MICDILEFRKTLPMLCLILQAVLLACGAARADSPPFTTHLLAIGVCPPWKQQSASVCRKGVETIAEGLTKRLAIAPENHHLLVNADATTEGLKKEMAALASQLGPRDRLIIYANVHSGALDRTRPAGPENDVIVLWSEEKPEVLAFGVAEGTLITASDFAAMVHKLPAGEVVVLFDACESGAITPLFLQNHPDDDPSRPEAVVTSAKSDQLANFAADGSIALFTEQFGLSLQSAEGELKDAVMHAAAATAEGNQQWGGEGRA